MEFVTSKDGTNIAYETSGSGSPLIIVGGSLADHTFYAPLAEELAKDFTVYNFDRRGRGKSGDTSRYAVEREVEDLAAIVDLAGGPVILYGHSAGSALALQASASGIPVASLVLADPPYTPRGDSDKQNAAEFAEEAAMVQELHDQGKHTENIANFLGSMGLPEEAIEEMLQSPVGAGMIASAKALPHDYAVLGNGLVPIETAEQIKARTVILAAGYSLEAAQQLAEAMPNAELKTLASSTHEMLPDELAGAIKEALK